MSVEDLGSAIPTAAAKTEFGGTILVAGVRLVHLFVLVSNIHTLPPSSSVFGEEVSGDDEPP